MIKKVKINKNSYASISLKSSNEIVLVFHGKDSVKKEVFDNFDQLKNYLNRKTFKHNNYVLVLGENDCIFKTLNLPAKSDLEALEMLSFEIEAILPVDKDRMQYTAMPFKIGEDSVQLKIFIAMKNYIEKLLENFSDTNIKIKRVVPAISSVERNAELKVGDALDFHKAPFSYLNLLPQSYEKRKQKKDFCKNLSVVIVLIFFLFASIFFLSKSISFRFKKQEGILLSQIEPIKHIAKTVESKKKLLNVLRLHMETKGIVSNTLTEIYKITPHAISISNLQLMKNCEIINLNINGRAKMLSDAFGYTEVSKDSNLLKKLNIINVQQIPTPNGKSVVEFSANCIIEKGQNEEK